MDHYLSVTESQPSGDRTVNSRAIWALALPAFGALVAQPAFLLIDAAVVGTLGTIPLAAVGAASTLLAAVVGLTIFLAYATTAAVARRLGAGDRGGALAQGVDGLALALVLGGLLGVAVAAGADVLAGVLGASGEVAELASTYLRITAVAMPALLGVLAGVGVLRGLQDTRTTLVVTLIQVAVNTVLVLVFVLGLDWGVAGSAWAIVAAEYVGLAGYVAIVGRACRVERVRMHPTLRGISSAARDGLPLFVRTIALRAVFLLAAAVAARLGDVTLAAYHVTAAIWFALALALDAIAIAGQALLGKVLGAGDRDAARAITAHVLRIAVLLGAGLGLAVLIARPWLPALFTSDNAVRETIAVGLLVVALQQPLAGAVFAWDGILIGAGDTRFLAVAQTAVLACFAPAAFAVLWFDGGIAGLWWAVAWFLLVRAVLLGWRVRGDTWLRIGPVR